MSQVEAANTTEPLSGVQPVKRRGVDLRNLIVGVVVVAGALAFPFVVSDSSLVRTMSLGLVLAMGAMGLNLLTGYNGQVSIGHGAFFGLGMYTTAILMEAHDWPFLPTLFVAAGIASARSTRTASRAAKVTHVR